MLFARLRIVVSSHLLGNTSNAVPAGTMALLSDEEPGGISSRAQLAKHGWGQPVCPLKLPPQLNLVSALDAPQAIACMILVLIQVAVTARARLGQNHCALSLLDQIGEV